MIRPPAVPPRFRFPALDGPPATWPREWLELWNERAALREFAGNIPREVAEREAVLDVRRIARARYSTLRPARRAH